MPGCDEGRNKIKTSKTKAVLALTSMNKKVSLRMPLSQELAESVGWRRKGVNRPCLVSYFLYSLYSLFSDDKCALCSKGTDES